MLVVSILYVPKTEIHIKKTRFVNQHTLLWPHLIMLTFKHFCKKFTIAQLLSMFVLDTTYRIAFYRAAFWITIHDVHITLRYSAHTAMIVKMGTLIHPRKP